MPIVYTEHNLWERYHPATRWGNLLTYGLNDHVFAVSDHVRNTIVYPKALSFLPMPDVETLYHGPDPEALTAVSESNDGVREELGIPPRVPVVGTVANLKPHKGHRQLLDAAVEVRRAVPETRFVLVGQGPLEDELRHQARDLGLEGAVVFAGFRADSLRVAKIFDLFVLPSVYEGLAIALVEAMALGKPAVVTRVGGLPEVVEDGKNGFIVPPANPAMLAQGIVRLLVDDELRGSFGADARRRASAFSMRDAVARIEDVYRELVT
jgi:glycosyltransferase involved in cell wall biosynthesis